MENISFWKLYTSQWSFKNEGKTLLLHTILSFIVSVIAALFGSFSSGFFLFWPALSLYLFCVYQCLKVIGFAIICYGVYYYAKIGEHPFVERYNEMLTWRKQ